MPIKDESVYPGGSIKSKEWKAIRAKIIARAHDHCELCFVPNGVEIWRMENGQWVEEIGCAGNVKIVLTIAHINQDPGDNRDCNLLALCQRCHNKIDLPYRKINAAKTNRDKMASGDLIDG